MFMELHKERPIADAQKIRVEPRKWCGGSACHESNGVNPTAPANE